jgi:hypothetical protein
MKTRFFFHILLMTAVIFLASCVKEGPSGTAGLDGADGADGIDGNDGADGNVTCLACHTGTTISAAKFQYAASTHKAGVNVAYAGSRSYCAECHSSEGFIEHHTNGSVASNISMPSAINCETCHVLHTTFEYTDFAMRASDPVTMKFDGTTTLDFGDNSNLCLNCHQTRTGPPNLAAPGETFEITSPYYGPHYGPQSNLFEGMGMAEIEGSIAYPAAGTTVHSTQASCTTCHMGEYTNKQGGHTWKPTLASCNSCHAGASEDFNYGGVQTRTYEDLNRLAELLVGVGIMTEDHSVVTGTWPMVHTQAFFNWKAIYYDMSLGAHNPQYINALLKNSIEALETLPVK